jgi:bifunctional N-acetylglucosamine-1-phosphate-uridyltransferase/glucosamine-1-phosphate-acetyltransferase GlmU-like protein
MVQIVIPMSGEGQRFKDAGYSVHKPLIEIDGKTMIQHVIELFNSIKDVTYLFICNNTHTSTIEVLNSLISKLKITAQVEVISPHKLGPVYAVSQVFDKLREDEVIVTYCDFGSVWSFAKFLQDARQNKLDGSIACYRGFHPHMLGKDHYAYCKTLNRSLIEIQEKKPFTNDKMKEWASNGIYYFRSSQIVKDYFQLYLNTNTPTNGEFYVSMVYNFMVKNGLRVNVFPIQRMLQWGTPYDLENYTKWSSYFKDICKPQRRLISPSKCVTILPMAGLGSRFSKKGYTTPKPLLDVNGHPMFFQSIDCLPLSNKFVFVTLQDYVNTYSNITTTINNISNSTLICLPDLTEGQACSTMAGVKDLDNDVPILITACDNASHYNVDTYEKMMNDESIDIIVWTFNNSPTSKNNPTMYSWVQQDEDNVKRIHVKSCPFSVITDQQCVIGTFFFRRAGDYKRCYAKLIEHNNRTNGEFYIDNMINEAIDMGLNVKSFLIQHYVCWGVPDEYETYWYWRNHFHLSENHPYLIFNDKTFNQNLHNYITIEKLF